MNLAMRWLVAGFAVLVSGAAWADRGYDDVFRCESKDREHSYCRADVRGDVVLVEQLSRSRCIEGQTWGTDRRGVWVSGGCRAEFAVVSRRGRGRDDDRAYDRARDRDDERGYDHDRGYSDSGRGGRGGVTQIKCESHDRDYKHCDVRVRGRVELTRQLSDKRCVYGKSWGSDRNGIWVNGGCRAEFVIYD